MKKCKNWGTAGLIGLLVGAAFWWGISEMKDREDLLNQTIDQSEEKENERLNKFFSELNSVYGYLSTTEDESTQLFIKIEEALLEGELTGYLLIMADTGYENKPYEETRYDLNGITDGLMVQFFTTVDGKPATLEGNFHGDAASFDLSYWGVDQKLLFQAVTEEEFNKSKTKTQGRQ